MQIIEEFTGVINRAKFDFIPAEDKQEFIEMLIEISNIVEPSERLTVIEDDPDDNKILECALCGKAGYIVSGDHHLLDLKEHRSIKILSTGRMLEILINRK